MGEPDVILPKEILEEYSDESWNPVDNCIRYNDRNYTIVIGNDTLYLYEMNAGNLE